MAFEIVAARIAGLWLSGVAIVWKKSGFINTFAPLPRKSIPWSMDGEFEKLQIPLEIEIGCAQSCCVKENTGLNLPFR
jgi:hypothetical protein